MQATRHDEPRPVDVRYRSDEWAERLAPWVRAPQQDRARRSLDRVLGAGAELLAEHGYEGFSVTEVCRRAGVSTGSLYGRVDGKRALFLAIHAIEMHRLTSHASGLFTPSAVWAAMPTRGLVLQTARTLGEHYLAERGLLRAFILQGAVDAPVASAGAEMSRRTEAAVIELLLSRREDFPHPDPREAVHTAYRMVSDSLAWRTAFGWDFGSTPDERPETWIEQLAQASATFLLTRPR